MITVYRGNNADSIAKQLQVRRIKAWVYGNPPMEVKVLSRQRKAACIVLGLPTEVISK